jgi:signal peptidase I
MDEPVVLVKRSPPQRGDIIVFKYPKDESLYYIKRTIGTPGDRIELRNKVLFINNEKILKDPLKPEDANAIFKSIEGMQYDQSSLELHTEHLGTTDHVLMIDKSNFIADNFGPIQVPQDQFFVMGDNRDFSNDSRFWGFVPMKNIRGKAVVIWLSLWINFGDWDVVFRPSRIGTLLH